MILRICETLKDDSYSESNNRNYRDDSGGNSIFSEGKLPLWSKGCPKRKKRERDMPMLMFPCYFSHVTFPMLLFPCYFPMLLSHVTFPCLFPCYFPMSLPMLLSHVDVAINTRLAPLGSAEGTLPPPRWRSLHYRDYWIWGGLTWGGKTSHIPRKQFL